MATIRTLVTKLVLDSREAVKGLKVYDALWKTVAKSVDASATAIERSSQRAVEALRRVGDGVAATRGAASAGPRSGAGGGRRAGPDPLDSAIRRSNRSEASAAGMRDGAKAVDENTRALGRFATASDKARAKVKDLDTQVQRNRKEMADLRAQIVATGDADGTLAARMRGLSVATGQANSTLQAARRELRAIDGSLIDAVKNAANLSGRFDAMRVAAGNLISAGISRALHGVGDVLVGSAKSAMDFEKALVDVAKVAQDADLTKEGLLDPRVKQGIKDVAKDLGVMPTEVAELTAQITAAFSGKTDIVALASDVTKIGVAWDISGKQAGEFFKQTSAGLQINADETKALFGSINELGNKLGIKSSEIAEAMTRSAGVLKGANISGETGAALNATLIKAGASAEVAATGVRTFIARLGAGEAATDKQIAAFQALGLSAKDVAKNLSSGDVAKAEGQIREVVGALVKMGEVAPDKRMATLIQLFGSESIGSIGAAASAVDTLAGAFDIAGNKAAALTSVQTEYDRVSNTTAARVEKLKANIGVLAIEFGEALLPHIDKVVNFLTSPEGQKWGVDAVAKAVEVVTSLADVIASVASGLSALIETLGGTTTAIGILGLAIGALVGPWGLAAGAAIAATAAMVSGLTRVLDMIPAVRAAVNSLVDATAGQTEAALAGMARRAAEDDQRSLGEVTDLDRAKGVVSGQAARFTGSDTPEARGFGYGAAPMASGPPPPSAAAMAGGSGGVAADAEARFAELAAKKRAGVALKPSEKKELRSLSKSLDKAIPNKAGRGHKATKMDRQLANLSPELRGLLTQGGEEDAGGDLKVHDDVLSRGAFGAALRGKGLEAPGATDRSGPGPNINTTNFFNNFTVNQQIDARGQDRTAAQNIAASSDAMAQRVNNVQFVGAERVIARRNAGGALR